MRKHIPNFITCLNLLSGCIAIVSAFAGYLHYAALWVGLATVFDFLDGFVARQLKAYSEIGKQLDSLADMLTFGFTPGVIIFMYLHQSAPLAHWDLMGFPVLGFAAFIISIFSALRLAKFNIDQRQSESFIGLPTPANALFFVSIPLILHYGDETSLIYQVCFVIVDSFQILLGFTILFSALLVSELPLFALKFKDFRVANNRVRYLFLALALLLLITLGLYALPVIIISYIALSALLMFWPQKA